MFKNINAIQNADTNNLVKKLTTTQNLVKLKKKLDHDHNKYITTQKINILTAENFVARLEEGKLASKADIADFF